MKKLTFILATAALVCSCTSEDVVMPQPEQQPQGKVVMRTTEEAIDIALNSVNQLFPTDNESRSISRRVSDAKVAAITDASSRAGEEDTLMYVVNFDDNQGYAIIAAPKGEQDVLAVVPEGNYNPAEGSDNPGLNYFLDQAADYTRNMPKSNSTFDDKFIKGPWEKDMPPITKVDTIAYYHANSWLGANGWGTTGIYGKYCPNRIASCSATAIATLITYYNYQEQRNGRYYYSFPERDVDYEDINWRELIAHKRSSVYDGSTKKDTEHICWSYDKDAAHNTIGRFIGQIGYEGNVTYSNKSSLIQLNDVVRILKKYLPSRFVLSDPIEFNSLYIPYRIDRGMIYIYGNNQKTGETHAWIGSGYDFLKTHVHKQEWDYTNKCYVTTVNRDEIRSMTYMNWGNDGLDDGYYLNNVFTTRLGTYVNNYYIAINTKP